MAPDTQVQSAGKKLGNPKHWRDLGQDAEAIWGECQGSSLYRVCIILSTLTVKCNCPSRKQPCKHGLGLLLIAATMPDSLVQGTAPDWLQERLTANKEAAQRKEARVAKASK